MTHRTDAQAPSNCDARATEAHVADPHPADPLASESSRQVTVPSSFPEPDPAVLRRVQSTIVDWFEGAARPLPWRSSGTSAWGVLVSEIMSQQTPMSRVAPRWEAWMAKWPTAADVARASTAEILLAWDSLGYPRRALRLQECARSVEHDHGGALPTTEAALLTLPGVGAYTAAAVASFAFGERTSVLDVNVRRVLGRVFAGVEQRPASVTKPEARWAAALVPAEHHVEFNAGAMELGALVCTARKPSCGTCPLAADCAWLKAGRPAAAGAPKKTQAWAGTDRQLRGAIMSLLRQAHASNDLIPAALLTADSAELNDQALAELSDALQAAVLRVRDLGSSERITRLVADLMADGLAVHATPGQLGLPA